MREHVLQVLQEYGLTSKDAHVYVTTLELGQAPASMIARYTGFKRVTTYVILEDLVRKQMMRCVTKNKTKVYTVVDPALLVEKQKMQAYRLEALLPDLTSLAYALRGKPKVQVFEGKEWVKECYDDLLTSEAPIYSLLGAHAADEDLAQWLNTDFLPRRMAKKLHAYVLLCSTPGNSEKYAPRKRPTDKRYAKYTQMKAIESKLFSLTTGIDLHGIDKVNIILFGAQEMSAITVQSKELYQTLRSLFDFMWECADGKLT